MYNRGINVYRRRDLFRIGRRAVSVPVKYAELKAFQIAFLIPCQRSHHGIHGVRFQVFGDFSRIVRLIQSSVYAGTGVYGTTGRLGEALIALCKKQFNGFGWEK